jgi:hypothetical protein
MTLPDPRAQLSILPEAVRKALVYAPYSAGGAYDTVNFLNSPNTDYVLHAEGMTIGFLAYLATRHAINDSARSNAAMRTASVALGGGIAAMQEAIAGGQIAKGLLIGALGALYGFGATRHMDGIPPVNLEPETVDPDYNPGTEDHS